MERRADRLSRQFALQVQAPTPRQQISRRFTLAPAKRSTSRTPTPAASCAPPSRPTSPCRTSRPSTCVAPSAACWSLRLREQTTSTAYPTCSRRRQRPPLGLKPLSREQRAADDREGIARPAPCRRPAAASACGAMSTSTNTGSAYVTHSCSTPASRALQPAQMQQKAADFRSVRCRRASPACPAGKPSYNADAIWQDRRYAGSGRFGVLAYGAYVLARQRQGPAGHPAPAFELRAQAHRPGAGPARHRPR